MIIRKLGDKKPKVVLFQGSPRDKETCPNMDSKTHTIVEYMVENWSPFINFKVIDLSVNQYKKPIIQPCKGCVSTAGGYHCHFPCSCYNKGDQKLPDLMHELDVYKHLQESDAFIVVSPIHWHSLSAQIKTMFDRLVCNIDLSYDGTSGGFILVNLPYTFNRSSMVYLNGVRMLPGRYILFLNLLVISQSNIKAGDIVKFAGNTTVYTVTEDVLYNQTTVPVNRPIVMDNGIYNMTVGSDCNFYVICTTMPNYTITPLGIITWNGVFEFSEFLP